MAEVTNYIDRLVAELCPEGVEYRPLESLGKRNKGTAITASKMRSLEPGNKDLRIFAAGSTFVDTDSSNIPAKDILHGPAIIVKSRGYIGFEYYEKSFTHKNEMWSYTLDSNIVNQKFIYYYLLTQAYYLQELARSKSVKLPQLSVKDTDSLEVPVPPLEIQEAIVEILDKFTNLEAELEAELEARTLQYEYYRGSLFGALKDPATGLPAIAGLVKTLCPDGVEYRSLKDVVAKNYGGGTPSKAKAEYWDGNIPWASVGDLSDDVLEVTDTRSKITEEGVKGSSTNIVPAGSVIVAIKINPGRMKIAGMNLAINQDIRGLVLNDSMNARFLTYYFRTLVFAGHGTIVKSITNKHLMETKIPVPPMEIQEAIVDILDRFDALTSSLSEGLPAELAARRSQYEYYRDQLLTFPRKGENQ
ncbi:restriction endonuclease subunit S [uncultured Rothia sp.]|uniref:restriction endonuclease subunit S n=1 Tax=uncultured Rothia sp. TaxID=316088 RepID=UPI0025D1C66D|nr:restriction endonuclease subunit S [uncultured Rothia sp.]